MDLKKKSLHLALLIFCLVIISIFSAGCTDETKKISGIRLIDESTVNTNQAPLVRGCNGYTGEGCRDGNERLMNDYYFGELVTYLVENEGMNIVYVSFGEYTNFALRDKLGIDVTFSRSSTDPASFAAGFFGYEVRNNPSLMLESSHLEYYIIESEPKTVAFWYDVQGKLTTITTNGDKRGEIPEEIFSNLQKDYPVDINMQVTAMNILNTKNDYSLFRPTGYSFDFYTGSLYPCMSGNSEVITQKLIPNNNGGFDLTDLKYRKESMYYNCYGVVIYSFSVLQSNNARDNEYDLINTYLSEFETQTVNYQISISTDSNNEKFLTANIFESGENIETKYIWHDDAKVYVYTIYNKQMNLLRKDEKSAIQESTSILALYKNYYHSTLSKPVSYFD